MAERECPSTADVTGVGGRGGIAGAHRIGHRGIADDAGPSAIANRLELPVPSARGQPDFDFDVRIAGGLQRRGHAAERGKIFEFLELTCRDEGSGGDGGIFQRERGKLIARRGKCGHRDERDQQAQPSDDRNPHRPSSARSINKKGSPGGLPFFASHSSAEAPVTRTSSTRRAAPESSASTGRRSWSTPSRNRLR